MEDDHEDKLVLDPNLKTADAFCQARKVNILSRKKKKIKRRKALGPLEQQIFIHQAEA